jgi:hypothetical protein
MRRVLGLLAHKLELLKLVSPSPLCGRRGWGLRGLLTLVLLVSSIPHPTTAQTSGRAWTHYALMAYSTPTRTAPIIGVLQPETEIMLEFRSADAEWLLGHTLDGTVRGWIEVEFIDYEGNVPSLLVSNEIMFVPPLELSTSYSSINLNDYPIVPTSLGRSHDIFQMGQIYGMNASSIAKIGDCITDSQDFLSPFSTGQYNLGGYSQLQGVITHFSDSLGEDSLAAYDGLVTNAALDPLFANPNFCLPGESPLRCEYRVRQPSVAIIMFGAQDLLFTSPTDFDRNLRRIVFETIQVGVIPILSTFPNNLAMWNKSIQYNQIVVQIALDFDIPLLNLWRALETIPNHGLNTDNRHLSHPITNSGDLSSDNLQRGYPLRNLVTLQALDAVWRGAMN